jgi:glycosyltransferase involved in cell wall biosynthesis
VTSRGRGAFILAHNRQEFLDQAIEAIRPQVDTVLVLDNASEPKLVVPEGVGTYYIEEQPPNLAKFWNMGLDFFQTWFDGRPHDVAALCDDAIVPTGWFAAVTEAMRETNATAGSSDPFGINNGPIVKYHMDSDIMRRMCSWAFVVDNTRQIRADESMHWWWFDTDFDIACRLNGGTVLISGYPVPNAQPGYYTNAKPELTAQAGVDGQIFAAKHGRIPW